jgi:hypothetical protein
VTGYVFVVARDFGFAPNPFHGVCTLATCKPVIRRVAGIGDWVFGVGGERLQATGRLVFAMRVSETLSFDTYWSDPRFLDKRPVRNGSQMMVVGDNIYHRDGVTRKWVQADSHHSNPDGSTNRHNLRHDTTTDRVLIADRFYYFGRVAPEIPQGILSQLDYRNGRGHRKYSENDYRRLLAWLQKRFHGRDNLVLGDPFDFDQSAMRYSASDNRLR